MQKMKMLQDLYQNYTQMPAGLKIIIRILIWLQKITIITAANNRRKNSVAILEN